MDAYGDSLALLARYPTKTPQELLQLLDAAVGLSGQVTERIARLGPASNRTLQARLMRELWASLAADRRDLASLKKHWNDATVRRMVARDRGDRAIVRLFRSWARPPAPISRSLGEEDAHGIAQCDRLLVRAALSLHLAESGGGELYRRVERQRRKLLALRLGDRLGLLLGELAEPAHQIVGIAAHRETETTFHAPTVAIPCSSTRRRS